MAWKKQIKLLLGETNAVLLIRFILLMKTCWYRTARGMAGGASPGRIQTKSEMSTFSKKGYHVFFGYYDITPFRCDNTYLLALHAPTGKGTLHAQSEATIGYYDLSKAGGGFVKIGSTTTWCWQQGCRLQWYPEKSTRHVLYNRLIDGRYGCVVQDIESNDIVKSFQRPVYSVSKDGTWGLSLNFSRLQRLRPGYGYANLPDETCGQAAPDNDGIWRINLISGEQILLFSLDEIVRFNPLESMRGAEHYFNHILFNPDGTRFMFLHVWIQEGKRRTRLITCDIDGKNKYALINEGHVSHYAWKSTDHLLAYATHKDSGCHYHLYRDRSEERIIVGGDVLLCDGHPSYSSDGSLLLTDTYADKYGDQNLLVYNLEAGTVASPASFYTPFRYRGEFKCDLHPRWSHGEKYICVDSACTGRRSMYLIHRNFCAEGSDHRPDCSKNLP